MMDLLCIEPGFNTRCAWPSVRDMIRAAIEKTNLSDFDAVERDVLQGRALLWLAWDGLRIIAAATTELALAQGVKACVVVACSGRDMQSWLPLLDRIEDYARAEGCASMRVVGRKGWARVLDGYRDTFAILEKRFQNTPPIQCADLRTGPVHGTIQPEHADHEQHVTVGCGDADRQRPVERRQRAASDHRHHGC